MAKPRPATPPAKGKFNFRMVELSVEGVDESVAHSVADGLRQLAEALSSKSTPVRALPAPRRALTGSEGEDDQMDDPFSEENTLPEIEEPNVIESEPAPPRKRSAPKAPKPAMDLDLDGTPMSFAEFLTGTTVTAKSSQMDQALAIHVYLRDYRNKPEINGSQLFTVLKHMGAPLPSDPTSPMRNLKKELKMDLGPSGKGYVLTLKGENAWQGLQKKPDTPPAPAVP